MEFSGGLHFVLISFHIHILVYLTSKENGHQSLSSPSASHLQHRRSTVSYVQCSRYVVHL